MTASPHAPWRFSVVQVVYGTDLRDRVDDATVDRAVTAMIDGTFFDQPTATYHHDLDAALRSGEQLAFDDRQDETAVRDLLTRIVAELDRRRPWPAHPFTQLDDSHWTSLQGAPVAGRLDGSRTDVALALHRSFRDEVDTPAGRRSLLVLHLRSGPVVGLLAPVHPRERGIDVVTHDDPGRVLTELRALTGIDAVPG